MPTLKRSDDRKVSAHHGIGVKNSFGLPAGISCPGMTSICGKVCYAKKIERMPYLKTVRDNLVHNWDALSNASHFDMYVMLNDMIHDFKAECVKGRRDIPKVFRIHWDGDFFSDDYASAWAMTIQNHPDVQFWAYTRSFEFVPALVGLDNLALYLSADKDNLEDAILTRKNNPWVKIALLTDTMDEGGMILKEITDRPGAKCPENIGAIELMTGKKGACVSCGLCVKGKADVRFAIGKK